MPPPPEQQPWLVEQLRLLIEQFGVARFLHAPLVEDLPGHAPNEVVYALLEHAGLGSLDVSIVPMEVAPQVRVGLPCRCPRSHGGGVWLLDASTDSARFAVEGLPSLPELGHDVAHAWREHHELCVEDTGLDERLTDLSAVYLGFGLQLLVPGRRRREVRGLVLQSRSAPALDVEAVAWLVGAQLAARDPSRRQLERMLSRLPKPRRDLVEQARAHFLGPGRVALSELVFEEEPPGQVVEMSRGVRPVQVVGGNLLVRGAAAGGVLGVALAAVGYAAFAEPRSVFLAPLVALLGGLIGWGITLRSCSNCRTALGREDVLCPGCGGLITE
ncbi:MAG: hypothetical protein GY913_05300 [Proteobacteria bacterium]|nr:hypothetical protein [Pseudomonadota bacterium]MCP4916318.1 hypothetical protein [Pseudomonadota bacterium]